MAKVSKKIYVASDIFLAFIDRINPKHDQAKAFFHYFGQEEYTLYTDLNIVFETYRTINEQMSPSLAKDFLRAIEISDINVLYPDENDTKTALKALIANQSPDLTFDNTLMAAMASRRSISQICTFGYLHALFGLQAFYLPI